MPESSRRHKIPVSNRRARPPSPSPSPSPRRRTPAAPRQSSKPSRPVEILQRCKSEPNLWTVGLVVRSDEDRNLTTPPDAVLFRPMTCTDIFSSAESFPPQSPQNFERYSKEAKVVVNVIVEGSPGPIRTMVKLGSSVEETIRLVINKYSEEGRSPPLLLHTAAAASTFQLHHSYFSLESLNKSDLIGDVGSRRFYLRSSTNSSSNEEGDMMVSASFSNSEIVSSSSSAAAAAAAAAAREITLTPTTPPPSPLFFLPAFIARNIHFIIRKTRKLWKLLGCLHCSGS